MLKKTCFPAFLIILFFTGSIQADCLMPQHTSFLNLLDSLQNRKGWEKSVTKDIGRLKIFNRQAKVDSLYEFANNYFRKRLPARLICKQVDVNDRVWFAFHKYTITMRFAFYLDPEQTGERDEKIVVTFTYYFSNNSISINNQPNNFWIPNCIQYPDSCNFLVNSKEQAVKIAQALNFFKDRNDRIRFPQKKPPPFHYKVGREIDDDCSVQNLYINSFNKDTILSPVFKLYNCATWKGRVNGADLVIDGTVVSRSAFVFKGYVYTSTEIEVHHLFKGKLTGNVITAVSFGGEMNGRSTSVSHGQVHLGYKGERSVFFLKRSESVQEKVEAIDKLLGKSVYIGSRNSFKIPIYFSPEKEYPKSAEMYYQRIEKIAGQKRIKKLPPQTWSEIILKERRNIPDREHGVAAFLATDGSVKSEDSIGVYISLAATNTFHYMDHWEISLSFDTLALGSWLIKNNRIRFSDIDYLKENITKLYDRKIIDKNASTITIIWSKKKADDRYFECIPIGENYLGFPILRMSVPVVDIKVPLNLELHFDKPPLAFDFFEDKNYEINYQYCSEPLSKPLLNYLPPKPADFFPKQASIGDTITLYGKHLTDATVMLFGKSAAGRSFFRAVYRPYIIAQSDDEIRFIIPPYLKARANDAMRRDTDTYFPVTKYITLYKKNIGSGKTAEELIIN